MKNFLPAESDSKLADPRKACDVKISQDDTAIIEVILISFSLSFP